MAKLPAPLPGVRDLGEYVREQRENAQLSVRQLSAAAGISNPYLSQIERGLRRPSAEILQALASGLRISVESLYERAGLLEASAMQRPAQSVHDALRADPVLSASQRRLLVDLYDEFVASQGKTAGDSVSPATAGTDKAAHSAPTTRRRAGSVATITPKKEQS